MNTMNLVALLVFSCLGCGKVASAQEYNLRTLPSIPTAGTAFLAAFDTVKCEEWLLVPDAEPPVVAVQGSVVRLEVDRISVVDCSNQLRTETLSVPGLPSGSYELELIGRAYQSPGNDLLAQAITFEVGPAVSARAYNIPANNKVAMAALAGVLLIFGLAASRRPA